eukprot:10092201-Heterocapsa_arctica.AAC.1
MGSGGSENVMCFSIAAHKAASWRGEATRSKSSTSQAGWPPEATPPSSGGLQGARPRRLPTRDDRKWPSSVAGQDHSIEES